MSGVDYVAWILDALERKPHLSRLGLAKHIGKHPSWVTHVLAKKREMRTSELDAVQRYLGEPHPGILTGIIPLTIVGRIGTAWYEPGEAPQSDLKVAPVLSFEGQQVAYLADHGYPGLPDGSVIIASPISERAKIKKGTSVIEQRERAGLINLRLARYVGGIGKPIAIAIEARMPVTAPELFAARPFPATHRLPNT